MYIEASVWNGHERALLILAIEQQRETTLVFQTKGPRAELSRSEYKPIPRLIPRQRFQTSCSIIRSRFPLERIGVLKTGQA